MNKKKYVSNEDESIPLFKNNFLDRFTHVHPVTPIVIYVPAIFYFLYQASLDPALSVIAIVSLFVFGVLAWTFVEYMLHRFLFHYEPRTRVGQYLHFLFHGIHHDYPRDSQRLVMPPVVSIPLAIVHYYLFFFLFGASYMTPFFAGFLLGYLFYDTIHYATHHFPMRGMIGSWLKKYHLRHHYQDEARGYGVSSPLWDFVFRTQYKTKHSKTRQPEASSV